MLRKLNLLITKYKMFSGKINDELTLKTTIKISLGSLLIAVLVILLPSLLIYNLFVFHKLRLLLKILIVLLVWVFSFSFNFAYDSLTKNYHENLRPMNTNIVKITDSVISGLILTIVTIILIASFF